MKRHINSRRLAAGLFLGGACLMLVLGTTILSPHLKEVSFLIYWLICFLLTGLAAIFALVDLVIIRHQSREEQRDLIKETLKQPDKDTAPINPSDSE